MSSSASSRSSARASSSSLRSSATHFSSSSAGSSVQGAGPTSSFRMHPMPSGNSSPCNDAQGCSTPPPATLYLYTFLSTLIILLLVSGGIIARSVVLRRRQQLAIANGTWVSPRRRENYSSRPQPVMFDAYVAADGTTDEEERWSTMKPFSASDIASPMKAPVPPPVEIPPHSPIRRAARDQMRSVVRLYNPFRTPPAPPPPAPLPAIELAPSSSTAGSSPPTQVRVAFLVAMPLQAVPPQEQDEEELPYLEFGVLDVDVVDAGRLSGAQEGVSTHVDLETKS